ncbi:hypothetical protein CCR94_00995 [Rhodoblastus sphagnicola]|uniref:Uncharacterized protein n=2 Tax=Rhodoblastus sphagnicola TaxID=333368 RepID=A0A2S6NGC4_9HYPH|nr:hypothetical protein CCR94_00995 [Rhodoblastus sphagnicola]
MSQEQLDRIFRTVARGGRSSCFWWFYDRYDTMRDADGKLRMTWQECCASLTALGVTAFRGRPLTPQTVRRTWKQVVEMKARVPDLNSQWPHNTIKVDTVH